MSMNQDFQTKIKQSKAESALLPIIDTHIHFVNFLQKTEGITALVQAMDKGNITKALLFGLPIKKKWYYVDNYKPHYYLDDNTQCYYYTRTDEIIAEHYLALADDQKPRFAPTICGFNPTDKLAVDYIEEMIEKYDFWKGIGELLLRHDDLTNLTIGEPARVNHPALFPVYELAATQNLPILLHQNSTSVSIHDHYEYLHEMHEVLQKFPQTIFIWAHMGISRRIYHKRYHHMIGEMLNRYPNLFIDISWIVYDEIVCHPNYYPKKEWMEVFNNYTDRIMLGSDLCGHFKDLGKTISRYNNLLSMLPDEQARKIAYENADKLWFS